MYSAAIIERFDNHLLIVRPADGNGEGPWGFPRGLVRQDETPEKAIRRIAAEQQALRVEIVVGQPPFLVDMNGQEVEIRYFICGVYEEIDEREPAFERRWILRGHLIEYDLDALSRPVAEWLLHE